MLSEDERAERVATIATFMGIFVGALAGVPFFFLLVDFDEPSYLGQSPPGFRIAAAIFMISLVVFGFIGRSVGLRLWWRLRS